MACLFFGTSTAELVPLGIIPANLYLALTTANQIAPYVKEGVAIDSAAGELAVTQPLSAAVADGWVSWYSQHTSASSYATMEVSANGLGLFRVTANGANFKIQYHNNTSWQNSGTQFAFTLGATTRFDFHFVIHDTTGTLTLYINGVEKTSTTFAAGDTLLRGESQATDISYGPTGAASLNDNFLSALMVHDADTRPMHYVQRAIDGAGGETDWSGAYTNIDETGAVDTDLIQAGTNADKSTFTFAALPASLNSGWAVVGLGVNARASTGATGPDNLQLAARHSATNGFSASKALGTTFLPYQHVFPLNPSTSLAWTFAEVDAAEVGVQAIT